MTQEITKFKQEEIDSLGHAIWEAFTNRDTVQEQRIAALYSGELIELAYENAFLTHIVPETLTAELFGKFKQTSCMFV